MPDVVATGNGHLPASARIPAAATAAAAVLLGELGIDCGGDGRNETPARFAAALAELTCGLTEPDPGLWLARTFDSGGTDPAMIITTGMEFVSVCEHHLLPFYGAASVAYLPADGARIAGVSKLSRLVTGYARRPQMQERLGHQIVTALGAHLNIRGAGCLITATHTCMTLRGAHAGHTAAMTTSHLTGVFLSDPTVRSEFLALAHRKGNP